MRNRQSVYLGYSPPGQIRIKTTATHTQRLLKTLPSVQILIEWWNDAMTILPSIHADTRGGDSNARSVAEDSEFELISLWRRSQPIELLALGTGSKLEPPNAQS